MTLASLLVVAALAVQAPVDQPPVVQAPVDAGRAPAGEDPVRVVVDGVDFLVGRGVEGDPREVAARSASRLRATRDRMAAGKDPGEPAGGPMFDRAATVRIFATHEERGLRVGAEASFEVTAEPLTCDVVVETGVTRQSGRAEALLFLVGRHGPAPTALLADGASYALADEDAVKDYRATAAWLEDAGEATPIEALLDPVRYDQRSALVQSALAAVLMELVLEREGPDGLLRCWRGDPVDVAVYGPLYRARLRRLVDDHRHWMDARRAARGARRVETRHRGVCFAHEGYRVHDGYLSDMARRSLERARDAGARAVSITPFGYYRDPNAPDLRWPRRTGPRAGQESDESILVASARARALGMTTMLKPHLWGHGWCGTIRMTAEADWDAWFANYGEFLVHYAILAERAEFDWLSIGCELVETTRGNADRWRALARRARRLFAGGLCYAANWGEEMERVDFADALDAIGVDFYFPLSDEDDPSDDALRRGAADALARTAALRERHGRPILLTEVGYPSRAAPWKDPFEVSRGSPEHAALQARCLRAFAAAFAAQDGVDGFYVWKWPTFDHWADRGRVDYWPAGEESMRALERAFAR